MKLSFVDFVPFTKRPSECLDISLHHVYTVLQESFAAVLSLGLVLQG